MSILNDEEFKIGLELEFGIWDVSRLIDLSEDQKELYPIQSLSPLEFSTCFHIDSVTRAKFETLVLALYRAKNVNNPNYALGDVWFDGNVLFDSAKMVLLLGLKPRFGWYREDGASMINVTEEVNGLIDSFVRDELCFADAYDSIMGLYIGVWEEVLVSPDCKENLLRDLAKQLSIDLGFRVEPFTGDSVKKYDEWLLEIEYIKDCSEKESALSQGFELVSPVMNSWETVNAIQKICSTFKAYEEKYGLVITEGCGLHINISHPRVDLANVCLLHAGLRPEVTDFLELFDRTTNEFSKPITNKVSKIVRKLVSDGMVSEKSLLTQHGIILTTKMIESMIPSLKSDAFRLAKKKGPMYMEYRFGGNSNYHKDEARLISFIRDLLRFHLTLKNYDQASIDHAYTDILKREVGEATNPSIVDIMISQNAVDLAGMADF